MNKTTIVFSYAGDLWSVPRRGGVANRLTAGAGMETEAMFSPDGKTIAFTGEYDGNVDIFTHCCPAKSRTESIGCLGRVDRVGSPMLGGPVKWSFFQKA
jgi:hypothetical protein